MVVNTKYRIVFIPFATYKRVGEVSILTVLGMPVYRRVGDIRSLFGIGYHAS
ncbi:MAG: hypothetical protein K5804_17980 [Microbacterium sp.]|uniref:hypothetical protein n=1 Tax=Microbacterium sp. TaxID=51671 RepID=UPI00260B3EBF|nr:hypothetical protein [Microbacterium sp.]MCV0420135.1 hypothetical protein [Microbacterium sp.]